MPSLHTQNAMKKSLLLLFGLAQILAASAQFEPRAGETGSTAVYKDSSAFKQWAKSSVLSRGYMNIANPDAGFASVGNVTSAAGKAGENGVASLGDGGIAILTFDLPIANGSGFDFAVFENGFKDNSLTTLDFLEYAFVEVSSDGIRYVRFPSEYTGATDVQVGGGQATDTRLYHNLAGKYVAGYGTPFDLEDLKDSAGLDLDNITHVKIVDVIGNIDPLYASVDSKGNKINDPWPTEFGSSGFDLDAVGVINVSNPLSYEQAELPFGTQVYPNPAADVLHVSSQAYLKVELRDLAGRSWIRQELGLAGTLATSELTAGLYILEIEANNSRFSKKVVIK